MRNPSGRKPALPRAQPRHEGITVKCPIMSRTKSSHSGHYETSVPVIWDTMRLSYMGTVCDHLGHYKTLWKNFLQELRAPPPS